MTRIFNTYAAAFAWANSFEAQDLITLPGYRWAVVERNGKFHVELR